MDDVSLLFLVGVGRGRECSVRIMDLKLASETFTSVVILVLSIQGRLPIEK